MAFRFFKKKKENKASEKQSANSNKYVHLKVRELIQETKDAITIVFDHPTPPMIYKPGQFLTLITTIDGKEVRRAYSLCSSPFEDEYLAVAVKRVENGLMSNYLADHLKVGDLLKVMMPMGTFTTEYNKDNKRHLIMFAGGSGITPLMSIIKSVLQQEKESVVSLLYANRNIASIIFKEQLDEMQVRHNGRLHVIHILDDAPMNWQGYSGMLDHAMLKKLFERIPDWGIDHTTYFMCGPEGMMNNVQTILDKWQIPKDKILKESFVAGIIDKIESDTEEIQDQLISRHVKIIYDGEEHQLTVQPKATILETALDRGIDLPYSCQSGLCTACRGKCLSGKVKMDEEDGLSEEEIKEGYVLTCVGHPLTNDVVIEIG